MTARDDLRDEIAEFVDRVLHHGVWEESGPEVADRIMGMLRERGWASYRSKPTPRVYLPGDTVPAGTWIMRRGVVRMESDWPVDPAGPVVEVHLPSPKEWQAAVDRARAEREADRG